MIMCLPIFGVMGALAIPTSNNKPFKLDLQYFAEGNDDSVSGESGNGEDGGQEPPAGDEPPKTFTQDQVTKMMATEKQQGNQAGQKAILDALGVETAEEAQKIVSAAKTLLGVSESVEGDTGSKTDHADEARIAEAEARATTAERKLYLTSDKVKALPEYHDSITVLAEAQMKSDATLTFEEAVEKVRELHKAMFVQDKGTGTPPGAGRQTGDNTQGYGARAAAINKQKTGTSSFFKRT